MTDYSKLLTVNPASSRQHRSSRVLKNGYIAVDERDLAKLLLAVRAYAENLQFYNLDGEQAENWAKLLRSSDAMVLAELVPFDARVMRAKFITANQQGVDQSREFLWQQIKKLDNWLDAAKRSTSESGRRSYQNICRLIQSDLSAAVTENFQTDNLHSVWQKRQIEKSWPENHRASDSDLKRTNLCNLLVNAFSYLSLECSKALKNCLQEQAHEPATALILSFLNIYQKSQTLVNRFPEKLQAFYYNEILQNQLSDHGYDSVFLHCQLQPGSKPVWIEKKTLLSAGKTDTQEDRLYETINDAVITGTDLKALKTVFLQRHPLIAPENLTHAVSRIKYNDILLNLESDSESTSSLFGYDDGFSGATVGSDAYLGLVLTSPLLRLQQGKRRIELTFRISDPLLNQVISSHTFNRQVSDFLAGNPWAARGVMKELLITFSPMLDETDRDGKLSLSLFRFLRQLFNTFDEASSDRSSQIKYYYKSSLLWLLLNVGSKESFRRLYRQFICTYMMEVLDFSEPNTGQVLHKASEFWDTESSDWLRIKSELELSPKELFYQIFGNAFQIKLTTMNGWHTLYHYSLSLLNEEQGFSLSIDLETGDPGVSDYSSELHGEGHQAKAPLLILGINPKTRIFPYSYLEPFTIEQLNLVVDVKGFNQVVVQNDFGLLDHSKPFQPFGPLPETGASVFVGGYEFARKPLSSLKINIQWRQLPDNYGGFASYYEGYSFKVDNHSFQASLSVSGNGRWQPGEIQRSQQFRLFNESENSEILLAQQQINIATEHLSSVLSVDIDETEYRELGRLPEGHIRVQLKAGKQAFGHKAYPREMAAVLTHNARSRKPRIMPQEPYTPEIEQISLDYRAEEILDLASSMYKTDSGQGKNTSDSELYYLTPVGCEPVYDCSQSGRLSFFPHWHGDGNLYISYDKQPTADSLNLFFHFKEDSLFSGDRGKQELIFRYFSESGWKPLPKNLIQYDDTKQLRQSGIITIHLPNDNCRHSGIRPEGQYWLCITAISGFDQFPSLKALHFDTVKLKSVNNHTKLSFDSDVTQSMSSDWRTRQSIPGITELQQISPAKDCANAENRHMANIRLYERLRHKGRALSGWDYERLVLQNFPKLQVVKCFAASQKNSPYPSPGNILLIVVPNITVTSELYSDGHQVNSVLLRDIADFLQAVMPEHTCLEVANPDYEMIQVRCSVSFHQKNGHGQLIEQLNRAISDYLSPWSTIGCQIEFGWCIREEDIKAYIRSLSYVKNISQFSMVKVRQCSRLPKSYALEDSAAEEQNQVQNLRAGIPWSLAIPAKEHLISLDDEKSALNRKPKPAGIENLEIGSTFVIKGRKDAFS